MEKLQNGGASDRDGRTSAGGQEHGATRELSPSADTGPHVLNELAHRLVEEVVGNFVGVAGSEGRQIVGQGIGARHLRPAYQHRNDMDLRLKRLGNFPAHQICRIAQTRDAFVVHSAQPGAADHGQEYVALRDCIADCSTIILA
jgi:hypothetical protein